jgi:hypothetical protein
VLSLSPRFAPPFVLPVLLPGLMATIAVDAAGGRVLRVAFGALSLPAGGLVVSGVPCPKAVELKAGGSVAW